MKSIKIIYTIFFFFLLGNVFAAKSNKKGNIILSGKVVNIDKAQNTIQFIFPNVLDIGRNHTAIIDENGNFKIELNIATPQSFYLKYGRLVTLFCSPGDSLQMVINAELLNNTHNVEVNNQFFVKFTGGTAQEINQNILKYLDNIPKNNYKNIEEVKNNSPKEYTKLIADREKAYKIYLNAFITKNKVSELFKNWAMSEIKYGAFNDLMRYRWEHPYRNGVKKEDFNLPEAYFNFLEDYNMNDDTVIVSNNYVDFLGELLGYSFERPKYLREKAAQVYAEKGLVEMFEIIKKMLDLNVSGYTKELFLTRYYIKSIEGISIKEFEDIYEPDLISNTYLSNILDLEYNRVKKTQLNKNTDGANLTDITATNVSSILEAIVSKYKGKVIYLDFWAPWCTPCMEEMEPSRKIQKYFKNKDVVFLFLASKCSDESWKSTIARKELTGEHINLTNDQYNLLESELGINGIPHYSLINKEGELVFKKTFRPSEENKLKPLIEELLNK